MASIHLNPSQRRYLGASLYTFELALREVDRILAEGDAEGILFSRKMHLTERQRQLARTKIQLVFDELSQLVKLLGLAPREENPEQMILAEMSVSWANLEDCRSKRLASYGELAPEEGGIIDPLVDHLAQAAIELTRIIAPSAGSLPPDSSEQHLRSSDDENRHQ